MELAHQQMQQYGDIAKGQQTKRLLHASDRTAGLRYFAFSPSPSLSSIGGPHQTNTESPRHTPFVELAEQQSDVGNTADDI